MRKMTWVLIAWCGLIVLWAVVGGAHGASENQTACEHNQFLSQHTCESARNAGTGIGVAIILLIGFVGFVFLALIWLMTKPRVRACPVCGEDVKRGRTDCGSCGHDFAAAAGDASA